METARSKILPTRALTLLLVIGFVDLLVTAILHAKGLIVELNPLMKPLIEHSEWTFGFAKGATLVSAWIVMAWYAQQNRDFVRKICLVGSCAYVAIWTIWFFSSM